MTLVKPQDRTVNQVFCLYMDYKYYNGKPLIEEDQRILDEWISISTENENIFKMYTNPNLNLLESDCIKIENRFGNYHFIRENCFETADSSKLKQDDAMIWLMAESMFPEANTNGHEGEAMARWAMQSDDNQAIYDQYMMYLRVLGMKQGDRHYSVEELKGKAILGRRRENYFLAFSRVASPEYLEKLDATRIRRYINHDKENSIIPNFWRRLKFW